jgi:L-fuconolactonase
VIDAHQHCWQIGKYDCHWPTPDLSLIYRDFGLEDLIPLASGCGVTGSVVVQSQTSDADTDYLLALAAGSAFVKAVVGWVDLAASSAPARIAALAKQHKLRGLRPMLQSLPEDDWILRPELEPAIAAMKEHRLSFDALVYTRHLPYLETFARRHPDLPIVIDHAAKPAIAINSHPAEDWCSAMAAIARLPNVYCKISGLVTEANEQQEDAVLIAYTQTLLKLFGAERLMWGSDWPVIGLEPNKYLSTYKNWLNLVRHALSECKASDFENVFIGTSLRFYQIA